MPVIEITVQCTLDSKPLDGFPFTRRVEVSESQTFNVQKTTDVSYTTIPSVDYIPSVGVFLLRTDSGPVTLRFAGQSDAGIPLNAGALIAIVDAAIASGAATNVKVLNGAGATASLRGLVAGT